MRTFLLIFLTLLITAPAMAAVKDLSRSKAWVTKTVRNLDALPESDRVSLYFLVSTFQCRLDRWRDFKPFYDQLFSRPEIKKAYPDALPQDQTDKGFYISFVRPGKKITDDSPLAPLTGKTIEEVFGYPGDLRRFELVPGMGSRQLLMLQPHYFAATTTGRYNTGYHEFGHFLHLTLMTEQEFEELESLYRDQKSGEKNFLDSYAAGSSAEYFAQALEAYLSETKPSTESNRFHRSTKQDLLKKDPKLFDFVRRIIETSKNC